MEIDKALVSDFQKRAAHYRHKPLLVISKITGRLALGVGWGIFFIWLILLVISGKPSQSLMMVGYYWIGIAFVIGMIGLICLISFMIINRKQSKAECIKALGVLLSGIPSVFIIIYLVTLTRHL